MAFGFAYFRFPGRNLVFGLVLATMMLPAAVTMIPSYLVWNWLGPTDTQIPLWAHNLFGSAFYSFLLRQFFLFRASWTDLIRSLIYLRDNSLFTLPGASR